MGPTIVDLMTCLFMKIFDSILSDLVSFIRCVYLDLDFLYFENKVTLQDLNM